MNGMEVAAQTLWVPVIDRFRGEHFFLSNFYPAITPHRGRVFPSSEHAYMAAKTNDSDAIAAILAAADPAEAQRIGRAAPLIDGWEQQRFAVMEEIVTAKFTHNPDLAERLAVTTGALLVEGNDWHDQTWGSCRCDEHRDTPGANALGVILMTVRMRLPIG
ncbi:NADAR family protein [Mycobacterium marinum]|uniref:NADAR family protein n=1 Tax=Mycobacterium marinum TaxID=1781 RepID=UPI002358E312|nr:NADAR family protein [Mycobacterium marinum]MDC8973994.1 NADAR family protein [Mycobacterium marinum]